MSKLVFASVISEIEQSDIFMTVKARICETPAANLNGARVTEAFIDEIVGNEKRYVGLPLNADVKALTSGKYNRLGHLYDSKTGEFHSTQIGSFYKFEKEAFENVTPDGVKQGAYLVGYARIPKRNKKLSKAITELWADNALKFSFELSVGEYEELDDDTILIDASENNYLEGTAIVTFPACEEAVALELVAQKADDTERGEKEMADVTKPAEELAEQAEAETAETEATQIASEKPEEETAENKEEAEEQAEEVDAEKKKKCGEEADEEKPAEAVAETVETESVETEAPAENVEVAESENAAVVVRESHYEDHSVSAYDQTTGKEIRQNVSVSTETIEVQEGQLIEATDGPHIAEQVIADGDPVNEPAPAEPAEETVEDLPASDATESKKTAEQMLAELFTVIEGLKNEIAELKTQKSEKVVAEINPFTSELNTTGKYALLEKEDTGSRHYSLLEKA